MDEDEDGQARSRSRSRSRSRLGKLSFGADGEEIVSPDDADEDGEHRKRLVRHGLRRRHSFHDFRTFSGMRVLLPERMRIDVGLCGQLLVMRRREEHLKNALACLQVRLWMREVVDHLIDVLQVITSTLSVTNATLHQDYHSHQDVLAELGARSQIIAQIEGERVKADTTTQERNTLLYESEQFRVHELWRMASPPRQKVLDLREKVFGTGGRRLPTGVRGAHGRFNRVQWTLDGGERLVDAMGRTESEAEEEEGLEAMGIAGHISEEEEDVVEHPGIKPMWLLRFFTSWGTRWSGTQHPAKGSSEPPQDGPKEPKIEPIVEPISAEVTSADIEETTEHAG